MYKRLTIVSVIILTALSGLTWLGYHSTQIQAKGMEGTRLAEFTEVAEQIRQDVKRKLDEFIQTEQNRPYTDYQYYYVPENVSSTQQQAAPLRSPLGSSIQNKLAYGNFQIESDGRIITPYYQKGKTEKDSDLSHQANTHINNIKQNLMPVLNGLIFKPLSKNYPLKEKTITTYPASETKKQEFAKKIPQETSTRKKQYRIQSLENKNKQEQVITQKRQLVADNFIQNSVPAENLIPLTEKTVNLKKDTTLQYDKDEIKSETAAKQVQSVGLNKIQAKDESVPLPKDKSINLETSQTVQIRIEPFVPMLVPTTDSNHSIFGAQVFMLRHIQIENRHFLQGFQLNEKKLIDEIEDSAQRYIREGMNFNLSQTQNQNIAFSAILDFGFGSLALNLIETDPTWISKQINSLRNWYFSIIIIVFLAVLLGLTSLWKNARAQIKLAEKKDDFISAVSHELRTPLTSIRMYSEMLENNWIKSKEKTAEYHKNMRQESERLSRLIENVLDFSRIQKGRKKYSFTIGDVNKCIAKVIEMMKPYASQNGFTIETDFHVLNETTFDKDAITQIVINLLDNAVKYARNAENKTITIRTRNYKQFILIEVQDHGPGVPHKQRKKIFEQFYRCGSETTRETNGTGLGLALVKKFAQAHNGFVEIVNAKPIGAIFRVGLAIKT